MKLVSFRVRTPIGIFTRVGAMHRQQIVDLNMAYVRWLADQQEAQPYRLANAQVPQRCWSFSKEDSTLAAARRAKDYVTTICTSVKGPSGETIVYSATEVQLAAPSQSTFAQGLYCVRRPYRSDIEEAGTADPSGVVQGSGVLQREPSNDHWAGRDSVVAAGDDEARL